jgi:hypothetical protein
MMMSKSRQINGLGYIFRPLPETLDFRVLQITHKAGQSPRCRAMRVRWISDVPE